MTEAIQLALIGLASAAILAIPPTLVGLATLRQSRVNATKTDTVIEKATEIHVLANSTLSKSQALYDVAMADIVGLKALIAEMIKDKADSELNRERAAKEAAQAQIPLSPKDSL